jgi:hypothetical protein
LAENGIRKEALNCALHARYGTETSPVVNGVGCHAHGAKQFPAANNHLGVGMIVASASSMATL